MYERGLPGSNREMFREATSGAGEMLANKSHRKLSRRASHTAFPIWAIYVGLSHFVNFFLRRFLFMSTLQPWIPASSLP